MSNGYPPGNAGDGSTATFWWSDDRGDDDEKEYLWVDLGTKYYDISRIEIVWYGDLFAEDYRVNLKLGRNWNRVYENEHGDGGTDVITLNSANARYVMVECRRTNDRQDHGFGIAELRVFE